MRWCQEKPGVCGDSVLPTGRSQALGKIQDTLRRGGNQAWTVERGIPRGREDKSEESGKDRAERGLLGGVGAHRAISGSCAWWDPATLEEEWESTAGARGQEP